MTAVPSPGRAPLSSGGTAVGQQSRAIATGMPPNARSQRAVTAVIMVATVAMALWAIIGFMGQMSDVMASLATRTDEIVVKLETAEKGLQELDTKTAPVAAMSDQAASLNTSLTTISGSLGAMNTDVDAIAARMQQLDPALTTLNEQITTIGATNTSLAGSVSSIDKELTVQAAAVHGMRGDVIASRNALAQLPPSLAATNARLAHINSVVCQMGRVGVTNQLKVSINFLGIPNGSADIRATLIPAGGWRC